MPDAPFSVPSHPAVLVVDDEAAVRDAITRALRLEGMQVTPARDGRDALELLSGARFDAIVLDVNMPRLDGIGLCAELRGAGDLTPVLMLTARDAVDDRVAGLDAGADDYLVKPFALRELKARLRALLRRLDTPGMATQALTFADLSIDPVAHQARRGSRAIVLTKTEFLLLRCFVEHPQQVLSRTQLFDAVWGYDFGATSNALGVYMGYLRRKTEQEGETRLLHTVRGVGYVLRREP